MKFLEKFENKILKEASKIKTLVTTKSLIFNLHGTLA